MTISKKYDEDFDYQELLLSNPILKQLSEQQILALRDNCKLVSFSAGTVIFDEGDEAKYGYYLISGKVELRKYNNVNVEPKKPNHENLSAGSLFGLVPSICGVLLRHQETATASNDVKVVRFEHATLLSENMPVVENQLSTLFPKEAFDHFKQSHRSFKAGDIIFEEGSPPDNVYIILSGSVEVVKQVDEKLTVLGHIHKGGFFGERGILKSQARSATIIAMTDLQTLVLEGDSFRKIVASNPQAAQFFGEFESVYNFPKRGLVVNGRSKVNGRESVSTTYNLLDGRRALMASAIDQDEFVAQISPLPDEIQWLHAGSGVRAKIGIDCDSKIIGIETSKAWKSLETASSMLLDAKPMTTSDIDVFQTSGALGENRDNETHSQLICGCMGLTRGDVSVHLTSEIDLNSFCKITGAGSGCGSCVHRLGEMLAINTRQEATIAAVYRDTTNTRRFSLKGVDKPLTEGAVGQHIIIYAEIDGRPIERSFTLTEYAGFDKGYEITVKLEPEGEFTPWLFSQDVGTKLTLSVPAGKNDFLRSTQNLVMIAAGIGITPAMSVLKAIQRNEIPKKEIKILHTCRGTSVPLERELRRYSKIENYQIWDSLKQGRLSVSDIAHILKPEPSKKYWICGPEQFERDVTSHLVAHGIPTDEIMVERFKVLSDHSSRPANIPTLPAVEKNDADIEYATIDTNMTSAEQTRLLLRQIYSEIDGSNASLDARLKQMSHELDFEPNRTELTYAAKLAWRNSTKCVGRLYWKGLQVFDSRESDTVDSIFDAMELHLKYGTNNGKIRSAVTVLKAFEINKSPKILSPQLIRYAGYRNPDGTVTGDPGNVEITEIALANGWRGENGNFDVLPLIIEDANGAIHMRELDKRNILEVQISHPEYSWFADLGIKWYALPAISNCCINAFGKIYPIIMNGWYMGTEIGARNLADNYRYNLLPQIAKKMGVYRRDDVSLWKDKTLVELNIAVLHSFRAAGATIVDHHTAANEFMQFVEQEHSCGRRAETNWSWVVPPMSGATTPLFHLDFSNVQLKPAIVGYPETKEINRCPHV